MNNSKSKYIHRIFYTLYIYIWLLFFRCLYLLFSIIFRMSSLCCIVAIMIITIIIITLVVIIVVAFGFVICFIVAALLYFPVRVQCWLVITITILHCIRTLLPFLYPSLLNSFNQYTNNIRYKSIKSTLYVTLTALQRLTNQATNQATNQQTINCRIVTLSCTQIHYRIVVFLSVPHYCSVDSTGYPTIASATTSIYCGYRL